MPLGEEFQVNVATTSYQPNSHLGLQSDGSFVVVWESDLSDGDGYGVFARRFDAEGVPRNDELALATYTTGDQLEPRVAVGPEGDFVVVWTSEGSPGDDADATSIQGRLYSSEGIPEGPQFQVNVATTGRQGSPDVARGGSGDFVVVWDGNLLSSHEIRLRRFASDGAPLGDELQIAETTTSRQARPQVAIGPEGDFVVVWESLTGDGDGFGVRARRFSSDGAPLAGELQVNAYTTGDQRVPAVARDSGGGFVVAWSGVSAEDGDRGIRARRLGPDGSPLGDSFQVNTYTPGQQSDANVRVDAAGDLVFVWRSPGTPEDPDDTIRGRRFRASGDPVAGEFQVSAHTTGFQYSPSLAVASEGDFVVTWSGVGPGTPGYEIWVRRFAVTAEVGDRVFSDEDFDGRQDPGEPGIEGIPVHLRTAVGDLVASTSTDADGRFLFQPKVALDGVADELFLAVEIPIFGAPTDADVGSDDEVDSDVDGSGETPTFVLTSAGETRLDLDAGLIPATAVVGDRVWADLDADGVQDLAEPGVGGVVVRLVDAARTRAFETVTDPDGLYSFGGVASGEWVVEVVPPAETELTTRDAGADERTDSDVDPLTGRTDPFGYSAGTIVRNVDAGLVFVPLFADGFESGDTTAW